MTREKEPMSGWQFWIDRGGTFTDCIGVGPTGEMECVKVLSSDRAPLEGIRRILGLSPSDPIPPCEIKMGTTVATNALLERKGCPHALLITRGFADALLIGTQQRPELFNLRIEKPAVLYQRVVEVEERISASGEVLEPLDPRKLRTHLELVRASGIDHLAVLLLHAYAFPMHEKIVEEMARDLGFTSVSLSHEVCPELGFTARGDTTTVDAYLTPLLLDYLANLQKELPGSKLKMMQSSGGLTEIDRFRGHNSILSGPAAGVVACGKIGEWHSHPKVIGFDMGGTSTDVSRFSGEFERVYETQIAGVRVKAPMLSIHTVAAGGGSLCRYTAGRLTVGPDSAGSDPGPLCYGLRDNTGEPKASELAVTDLNFFLGRILPENFPFPLEQEPVTKTLEKISDQCGHEGNPLSPQEVAEGFLTIVNLQMAQAIKEISIAKGHDPRDHTLICFGGAGGQHACAVARNLGIETILLHPLAGALSAYGIGVADNLWEGSAPVPGKTLGENTLADLEDVFAVLEKEGKERLLREGFSEEKLLYQRKLDLRYCGTEVPLTLPEPAEGSYQSAFAQLHRDLFGYVREDREIEVLQCRLSVTAPSSVSPPAGQKEVDTSPASTGRTTRVWFEGERMECPVFERDDLAAGALVEGPALILEAIGTVWVEPGFEAVMEVDRNLLVRKQADTTSIGPRVGTEADPIGLEIFNNLFMSVAEQMGRVLQRTSVSTNIKERLDYSCAVFDEKGRLVANAPHIPVHLGAMGESVRAILQSNPEMRPGDVFVTNNPYGGGSHLPDITLVTPVFVEGEESGPAFFTASRAHHADVGGISPGSVPPFSKSIEEEGILLDNVRLVREGEFQSDLFQNLFLAEPFPARNLKDNLADLQAQIAANQNGARTLLSMVENYTYPVVQAFMGHVRDNAAHQVRGALQAIADGEPRFGDFMDDGTRIEVTIRIDGEEAVFDFEGTGPESETNLNAPRAVVCSAVLYVLRSLVSQAIPLNEGCLEPVEIRIPEGTLLSPSPGRAVVGGNVETSQRVVDVLLGALGLAAASQGTMNNVTFGDDTFGYYETIAGGVGAGSGYQGASGVHTHMTNTRITDPEVLETRHPVRLVEFSLRQGTGGEGRWSGGEGIRRRYRFLKDLNVSLLTERRKTAPYGLAGGANGGGGKNTRILPDGMLVDLGGRAGYRAERGEELLVETPGGGGYGEKEEV